MMNASKKTNTILLILVLILVVGCLISCQSSYGLSPATASGTQSPEYLTDEEVDTDSASQSGSKSEVSINHSDKVSEEPAKDPSNLDILEVAWQSSPHADAFVLDNEGNNNTCARCHAPVNWLPSMDDLPESCYACKFELEDPPPYISEDAWLDIPCMVCHEKDKKDNLQPEIAWLEIAQLEEYSSVSSPTELCLKCHNPINVPNHGAVQVGIAHSNYECTECHDAHDTVASCGEAGCHEEVIEPAVLIPGHDTDHQEVSCVACHDGADLEVGPSEDTGVWVTYVPWTYIIVISESETKEETGTVAFASHNLVIDASCKRCHFSGNPWGLSEDVSEP
jgi:hypothetical protein